MKLNLLEKSKIEEQIANFLNIFTNLVQEIDLESDYFNLCLSAIIFGKCIEKQLINLILKDASLQEMDCLLQRIEEITKFFLSECKENHFNFLN